MAQKSLEMPYTGLLERHTQTERLHWGFFPDLISQLGTRGSPGDLMPSAGGSSHGCSHLKPSSGILTARARSPPSCFWNESWNRSQLLEFLVLQVLRSDPELHHYGLSISKRQKIFNSVMPDVSGFALSSNFEHQWMQSFFWEKFVPRLRWDNQALEHLTWECEGSPADLK